MRTDGEHRWTATSVNERFVEQRVIARDADANLRPLPASVISAVHEVDGRWTVEIDRLHPSDRSRSIDAWWEAIRSPGEIVEHTVSVQDDGEWFAQRVCYLNLLDDPDFGVVLIAFERLGVIAEPVVEVPAGGAQIIGSRWLLQELDEVGRILRTEGTVEEIFGCPAEELVGAEILNHMHPDDRTVAITMWLEILADPGSSRTIEQRIVRRDGGVVWIASTVRNQLAVTGSVLSVSHDITAQKRQAAELSAIAERDALTGIVNRRGIGRVLRQRLSSESDDPVVVFGDLDSFKVVNDQHGHAAGDAVLIEIGHRLRGAVRPNDVVGRWGGDEFVTVCSDVAAGAESELLERIRQAVIQPIPLEGGVTYRPEISLGVVRRTPGTNESDEDLLRRADTAMYEAKRRRQWERQQRPPASGTARSTR